MDQFVDALGKCDLPEDRRPIVRVQPILPPLGALSLLDEALIEQFVEYETEVELADTLR